MGDSQSKSKSAVKLIKLLNATRQEVFAAWITAEYLKQWMCPEGNSILFVEIDVQVGGKFRIDMQRGEEVVIITGVYHEIKPPAKLAFSWMSKYTQYQDSLVTVELFERSEQTELVLTHELLPDDDTAQGHASGWASILSKLAAHLLSATEHRSN